MLDPHPAGMPPAPAPASGAWHPMRCLTIATGERRTMPHESLQPIMAALQERIRAMEEELAHWKALLQALQEEVAAGPAGRGPSSRAQRPPRRSGGEKP